LKTGQVVLPSGSTPLRPQLPSPCTAAPPPTVTLCGVLRKSGTAYVSSAGAMKLCGNITVQHRDNTLPAQFNHVFINACLVWIYSGYEPQT